MVELVLPTTIPVTLGAIGAFLTLFASIIGIYWRLRVQMTHLEGKVDRMAERNKRADAEADEIKAEQAAQRTVVAVMAEQLGGMGRVMDRIDRNVDDLIKVHRND